VSKLASSQSNAAPGTLAFLAAYPQALTTTLEALSKEEKLEFQKLADKWNEEGPPDEQKRKQVSPSPRQPALIFISLHVSGMPASFLKSSIDSWLTSRGQWVSKHS